MQTFKQCPILFAWLVLGYCLWLPTKVAADDAIIVVGAGGTADYTDAFTNWAGKWRQVLEERGDNVFTVGLPATQRVEDVAENTPTDRERLLNLLQSPKDPAQPTPPLWLVLIGHGTFGQGVANFNLNGPDISATQLGTALKQCGGKQIIINCASASGPFLTKLHGADTTVITATQSGDEQNFARFGGYLAEAITDPAADLDHDARISLLEAFLLASKETAAFYERDDRLQTEHALLDDNGDGKGTPSDFYRGVRVTAASTDNTLPDGGRARQTILVELQPPPQLPPAAQQRVTELEQQIESLRTRKSLLSIDEYYAALEPLMIELASLERSVVKQPDRSSTELTPQPAETTEPDPAETSDADAGRASDAPATPNATNNAPAAIKLSPDAGRGSESSA